MDLRRHDFSVLAYCHEGNCQIQLGSTFRLEAGSLMLLPGWAPHRVHGTSGQLTYLSCQETELPVRLRQAVTQVRLGGSPLRARSRWTGETESLLAQFVSQEAAPLWVQEAVRLVFQPNKQPWSLTRLAEEVSVSPAHLTTQVRRWTGQSLGQWSLQARLEEAALQLRHSPQSVAQVAEHSGFADLSHFRRLFRRRFQSTPQEYRNL
ncbi:MAG: helix-turn-helix domain-containing protein [Candidatus Eremiobacteraeota bacterium]|nr:helix-turn-helix domain-containing protein [Candidatus Eremiobacteraeota bacterium]MCW5870105.1 helix-turn-helix domain-containing protein [Candidatus Eremiobacteraeota bacterium]